MHVELEQSVIKNVKRVLAKYFAANSDQETQESFEEAMLVLQQVNDCIDSAEAQYEDYIEDFVENIHV